VPARELIAIRDDASVVVGVVTKSDIVRRVARREDMAHEPISRIMCDEVVSCALDADLREVWRSMSERGLRNVPVLRPDGAAAGVLSAIDALEALLKHEKYQETSDVGYVEGMAYRSLTTGVSVAPRSAMLPASSPFFG
jgi:signal-transduction protein with cAMP-binding, CBS, and nucleotidyltransferase domain